MANKGACKLTISPEQSVHGPNLTVSGAFLRITTDYEGNLEGTFGRLWANYNDYGEVWDQMGCKQITWHYGEVRVDFLALLEDH